MSKGGKGKVGFSKPPEPKFIRDLKAKVGYKEPVGLEAKMGGGDSDVFEDRDDRDDERPTVVVLKNGDLTEEEAENVKQAMEIKETEKSEEIPSDGRIMFKKPSKRVNSDKDNDKDTNSKKKKKKIEKVSSLLSFDEEEEDCS